jgi:hypothetical protein
MSLPFDFAQLRLSPEALKKHTGDTEVLGKRKKRRARTFTLVQELPSTLPLAQFAAAALAAAGSR